MRCIALVRHKQNRLQ